MEDVVNDDGGHIKQNARDFIGMGIEFLAGQKAVEYDTRIGASNGLDEPGSYSASIRLSSSSQVWP